MFGITGSSYGTPSSSRPQTSSRVSGAGVRGIQSLRNASSSTGKVQNSSSSSSSNNNNSSSNNNNNNNNNISGTSAPLRSNPYKSRPVNPDAYQPSGYRPGANSALPRDGSRSRVRGSSTPNYGRGRPASASQTALQRFSHSIGPTAVRFGGKVYRLDPATGKLLSPQSAAAQKREAARKWTPEILAQVKEEERVKALEQRKKITQQQRNRGKLLAPGEKAVHTTALARLGLKGTIVLLQNKLRHSSRLRHNLQVSAKHAPGGATVLGPEEFAKAVENAGVRLHPDDVESVFQYADDDNTGSVTFSHLLARITNDFADQGLAAQRHHQDNIRSGSHPVVGAPSTTLAVAPDDEARYARSRANHRAIMEEAATAVLPRMGFPAADEHLRAKYQSKGEHLRRVFLRICRGRGPLVNRTDMQQALHDFGIQFHPDDENELLDHYLDPRNAVAASTAAAPAKSPPPAGRIDYHIFLDLLGRDVAAAQPLFGEMFEREAQARAEAEFGKRGPEAVAKAQGFKHVQEVLQKHLDRSDSLLLSFLAADVDEKAAISFDAFLHLCQDAGFNFAISDLEAVFGRSDNDQDHHLDLDEFLRMFCRDRYAYDVNLKTLPSSAFEQTLIHAREGRPLPRLGARRCREVVVNAFQNQADKKFMEVFRRQFLKTLSKRKITEMPDDPAEQDRLILEAALNFDEFTVFVQEITNLRLAMSDLKGLFDSFSETQADADNGNGGGGGGGGNGTSANRVVPLKKFINHFNNYTEERFSFLKSYILNPYHRDMTFASRVPEIGVDRVRETLEKKCVQHLRRLPTKQEG